MDTDTRDDGATRRAFLRGAGLGLGSVGLTLALTQTVNARNGTTVRPLEVAGQTGYQETAHVRRYYALARS